MKTSTILLPIDIFPEGMVPTIVRVAGNATVSTYNSQR